jgi:hypothetical protein
LVVAPRIKEQGVDSCRIKKGLNKTRPCFQEKQGRFSLKEKEKPEAENEHDSL